uniref:CSN8_PSD8_EIF3K domain-containing protein n=1 Tax=Rhabditophanes sp. KR3021 TaxID=114890 RepID=A0AC35TU08_9BILA
MALTQYYKSLVSEWSKDLASRDATVISNLLQQCKAELGNPEIFKTLNQNQCTQIHKDIFEIDALYRAGTSDINAFKQSIAMVLNFYKSHPNSGPEAFPQANLLTGLHLMYLLAVNDLPAFHMHLEQISPDLQANNSYISVPVKIEQFLNEGAFNKIVLTEKSLPSPYYLAFIRILMNTVREEIANNIEQSFKKLSSADATHLLLFANESEFSAFAQRREWKMQTVPEQGNIFLFEKVIAKNESVGSKTKLDTSRITNQTLFYAKQLEMIV